MPKRPILLLVAGALLLAVSLASVVGYILSRPPYAVRTEQPVLVTADHGATSLIEAHNTPSLAVDPSDRRHLVLAEKIDRPRFGCAVHVSTDGGSSWTTSTVPLPAGQDTCYIPDVAFARNAVYLAYLTLNTHPRDPLSGGNDPNGMYLARSTDGGLTFGAPLDLHGHDNLQPRIAVDNRSGRLYIAYVRGSPLQNDTPLGLGPAPNPIMVISSTDGEHFTDPVQVSEPSRPRVAAPSPVVAPDGDLFLLYEDYKNDLDDYNNKAIPYQGTFALVLAHSRDGGRTFEQQVVDDQQIRPHRFLIYTPPFPALAVAPDGGHMYVAWSDGRNGAPDILLRSTADGGKTWSAPTRLDRRVGGTAANFELPALAAGPGDRVNAAFYAVTGGKNSVQFTYSTDAGRHFQRPVAISSAFDQMVGPPSARYLGAVDWGSRLALAVDARGDCLVAWADSSRGTPDTGRQDIVFTRVGLR